MVGGGRVDCSSGRGEDTRRGTRRRERERERATRFTSGKNEIRRAHRAPRPLLSNYCIIVYCGGTKLDGDVRDVITGASVYV